MSLTYSALCMSHRTILTCSCAFLEHSRSVMEPLKTIPEFHPIPFKQGKYLSIKTRTLAKYNEARSGITERIASLETTLNKLKTQAACAITDGVNNITEHESSMPLPPLLHLPLPLAEEVTHLYSKINSVQGENGFVLDDALIYHFFHSLIAAGDYRTALVNVLHDKIIAEARGPPFPLRILEDLNYVLRCYVIPQLPCSTAHFSRIVPLSLDMCNSSNTQIVESNIDNINNNTTTTRKKGESNSYQSKSNFDRRREMERVLELAVQEEIVLIRSKHMSEHINGKQESEQIEPASEANNVDALSSSSSSLSDKTQRSIRRKKGRWQDSLLFSTQALTSSYKQSAHCHYIIEEFVLPIWQAASQVGLLCLPDIKELTNNNKEKESSIGSTTSVNEYQNEDEDNSSVCRAQEHKIGSALENENKNEQVEELLLPRKVIQSLINKIVHCFDAKYHAPLINSLANNVKGNLQTDKSLKSVPLNEKTKEEPLHKEEQWQKQEEHMTSSNRFTNKLQVLESVLQFYLNLACIASEVQDEHWLMEMLKLFCNICLQKNENICNKKDDTNVDNFEGKFAVTLNVEDWCTALLHSDFIYRKYTKYKEDTDDNDRSNNAANQAKTEFIERVSKLLRCFASEYLAVIYYGLHSIQRERQLLYAMEIQRWQSTFTKMKESLLSSLSESLSAFHASKVVKYNTTEEFVSYCNISNSNVDETNKNDFYQSNNEQNLSGDAELQSDWHDMYNRGRNEKEDEIINAKANEILHKALCNIINLSKNSCINVHSCSSIEKFNTETTNSKLRSVHTLIKEFLTSVLVEDNAQLRNNFDTWKEESANHKNDKNDGDDDDNDSDYDCVVTFAEPILNYILLTQDVEWLTTLSANKHWRSSLRQVLSTDEEWELYNALVKSNAQLANNTLHEEECKCEYKEEKEESAKLSQNHTEDNADGVSSTSYENWYTFSEKLLQSTTSAIKYENKVNTDDNKNNMSNKSSNESNDCTHLREVKSAVFERLQRIADGLVELFTSTHINTCTRELLSRLTPTHPEFTDLKNNNDEGKKKDFSNFGREENSNKYNITEHELREEIQCDKDNHIQTFVIDQNVGTDATVANINNESMNMTLSYFVSTLMHEASIVSSSDFSLVLTPYSITSLAFMILSNELTSDKDKNTYTSNIDNSSNNENSLQRTNALLSKLANIATKQLQRYKMHRAQHEQHRYISSSSNGGDVNYYTNNEMCELININNLEMLYTGNALPLFLLILARRHMWDDVLPLIRAMCGSSVECNLDGDERNIKINTNTTSSASSTSLASTHGMFYRSMSFITCQSMEPVVLCTLFRLARNDGACMICAELRQHRQDIFF